MENVEKIVHKNIHKLVGSKVNKAMLNNEMLLSEDLGLGSMAKVALFTNLTDTFKVDLMQFSDEELVNIKSIQDIIILFEQKVNR